MYSTNFLNSLCLSHNVLSQMSGRKIAADENTYVAAYANKVLLGISLFCHAISRHKFRKRLDDQQKASLHIALLAVSFTYR